METVIVNIGSNDQSVDITSVAGGGPEYTVTLASVPGDLAIGDRLEDEAAGPNVYLIKNISGNDLTVVDILSSGAPSDAGLSIAQTGRMYSNVDNWGNGLSNTVIYASGDIAKGVIYNDSGTNYPPFSITPSRLWNPSGILLSVNEADRHQGVATGGAASFVQFGVGRASIAGSHQDVSAEWLAMYGGGDYGAMFTLYSSYEPTYPKLRLGRYLLLYHRVRGTGTSCSGLVLSSTGFSYITLYNTIVYNIAYNGPTAANVSAISVQWCEKSYVYNNTAYHVRTPDPGSTGGAVALNMTSNQSDHFCINNKASYVFSSGTGTTGDFNFAGSSIVRDYNASSDETADGSTTYYWNEIPDDEFVSTVYGSEDLHLANTSAFHTGDDLSSIFTDDIDAQTRVNWHIGADEYLFTRIINKVLAFKSENNKAIALTKQEII